MRKTFIAGALSALLLLAAACGSTGAAGTSDGTSASTAAGGSDSGSGSAAPSSSAAGAGASSIGTTDAASGTSGSANAAASGKVAPPSTLAKPGVFQICVNIAYPPYEFFKTGTQTPDGSDIAVGKAIADEWGVKVDYLNIGFDGLIAAVNTGKCDAAVSGMSATAQRLPAASFVLYQQNGARLMVRAGNPAHISDLASLAGKKVGVMLGSTEGQMATAESATLTMAGKKAIDVITYNNDTDAPAALATGKIDAYFAASASVNKRIAEAPGTFEVVGPLIDQQNMAATVKKSNTPMLDAISAAVKAMYADGTMAKILKTWNMQDEALPADQIGKIMQ